MRSALLVAILVSTSAFLAGCSDDGGHEHEAYTCPDGSKLDLEQFPDHDNATFNPLAKCPKKGGSTGNTTTNAAPNVLPTLVLTVTDDGGNETPVTMLNGNLTFSAEGSTDSDGTITGIAVSVTDSNTTRTATLFDPATKSFKSATFKFDRPGVVNVTVAMVDDRAGFNVNQSKVYVNHAQSLGSQTITLPGGGLSDGCDFGPDGAITGASYFKQFSFALFPGATFVEASATTSGEIAGASAVLTICNPAKTAVSDSGNPVTTNAELPPPVGIESYYVGATTDVDGQPQTAVSVSVVVHYEPAAAAPAA